MRGGRRFLVARVEGEHIRLREQERRFRLPALRQAILRAGQVKRGQPPVVAARMGAQDLSF